MFTFVNIHETITQIHIYRMGLECFFCKGPHGKYFRLCGPHSLCGNYSILPLCVRAAKNIKE